MPNIQVTHGTSLDDARSESVVRIDPSNPDRIVGASRKCKNIAAYDFTVATVYSVDGGRTWHDSAALESPGWSGVSDPALAWDDSGNVFLIAAAITNPPKIDYVGIAVYKSADGGKSWGPPNLIHTSAGDEKACAAGDSGGSAYKDRVYIAWDDGALRFARTLDHGASWVGAGADPAGTALADESFSPTIAVSPSGEVMIATVVGAAIELIVSVDGGDSFHPVTSPATGITTLQSVLPPWKPGGWPVFPGATFRVFTIPTACIVAGAVIVAWADYREGVSRIYYARSVNGGATWQTGPRGQPLLSTLPAAFQHFHPQLVTDPSGVVGCVFYEYGPKPSTPLIDVVMAPSFDGGASFDHFTITDEPWDPTIDAPVSLVDPIASFIGEYMGLDASADGFLPLWTDTRTGIQELWTDRIRPAPRPSQPGTNPLLGSIVGGVDVDGGGGIVLNGIYHPIGPWNPFLAALAVYNAARGLPSEAARRVQAEALHVIDREVQRLLAENALEGR